MDIESSFELTDGEIVAVFDLGQDHRFTYEAPQRNNVSLQFYAPLRDHASMANVSTAVFSELHKRLPDTSLHNYLPGPWVNNALTQFHGIDHDAPIAYFIGVPDQVPEFFFDHPIAIGGFVCETDRILDEWVAICNRLALVTVPSNWCRDAFIASGVTTPVMVVPHGLDPEYRPYKEKERRDKLIFFNSFHSHSFYSRKGAEELVRSFLKVFHKRDDVVLRLRTDRCQHLSTLQRTYDFANLIETEELSYVSTEEYARIFSDVHCTVHPSRGEGFGLVPFQSVACETPVIAPHATGMADYLDANNSIELKTNGRINGEGVGNAAGTYFTIDEQHLADQLLYVDANWSDEYAKVRAAGPEFRHRHAWDSALMPFVDLIVRLHKLNDVDAMQGLIDKVVCA